MRCLLLAASTARSLTIRQELPNCSPKAARAHRRSCPRLHGDRAPRQRPIRKPRKGKWFMSEDELNSFFIEDLQVGQSASYERAISEADVREFAVMSGDINPIHLDEAYAQATRFRGR